MGVISNYDLGYMLQFIKVIHANGSTGSLSFTFAGGAWGGEAFGDSLSDVNIDSSFGNASCWIGFVRNLGGGGTQTYQGTILVTDSHPGFADGVQTVQLIGTFTEQGVPGVPTPGAWWWTTEAENIPH